MPNHFIEKLSADISFIMLPIQGGSFLMGSDSKEAYDDEQPIHRVEVPDFMLGKYPVTQAVWEVVIGDNPSKNQGANHPQTDVSWEDCQEFIEKLNQKTGKFYRLPTEAEWEFASRGGVLDEGYMYAGSDKLDEIGWYDNNSGNETHPVGLKLPNELGLYDMSGNVYEWCEDDWHKSFHGAPLNAFAWIDKPPWRGGRLIRGGYFGALARSCRVSSRRFSLPGDLNGGIGFRLASPGLGG